MSKQKSKPGTVKMKFSADQFYVTAANKEQDLSKPLYEAGQEYEIEEKMVPRWLKRGGVIVADEATDSRAQEPAKVEEKSTDKAPESQQQVDDSKGKEEDGEKSEPQKDSKPAQGNKPQQGGNKR